jgi:DNA-directed RNA polymerase specialized sigma24 family protein
VLERHDAAGGRPVRRIRAELPNADLKLSEHQRGVVELVVVRRLTHRHAADALGIPTSAIARHLRAIIDGLELA